MWGIKKEVNRIIYSPKNPLIRYGFALFISYLVTVVHSQLPFAKQTPYLFAPIPIILSTLFGGAGPGILAVLYKAVVIIIDFIPPYGVLKFSLISFTETAIFLFIGFLIVWLIESQRHIKEEILRRREMQEILTRAGKGLLSSLDYNTTLNNVAKIIVPKIADWCTIDLLNEKGKIQPTVVMHSDPKKVEWAKNIQKNYSYSEQSRNGVMQVIRTRKARLVPTVEEILLDRTVKDKELLQTVKSMGIKSVMIVPIVTGGKALGAITFVSSNISRKYDQTDLKFADDLANRMGQAIENSKLYSQAKAEISERKEAEKDLQDAKEQLEVILQNITDGITVTDKSGKLVFINDAAAKLAGFNSRQHMLQVFNSPNRASNYFDRYEMRDKDGNILHPEKLTNRRVLKGEARPEEIVQYYDKISGQNRWSLTRSRPVFDENDKIQFVVTIITDISKEKEVEKRKDEFISIASHELKTPMTSIKAYTQLLKFRLAPVLNTKFASYLDKMDRQIERLVSLINELLDVTKIQAGKLALIFEEFDVRDMVQDTVDSMKLTTSKHKFTIQSSKRVIITADRGRIEQVFNNLLVNAIKYSPKGGNIAVLLSININLLTVKVKDEGLGIAEDDQIRVFDRFNQANSKSKEGLSGLGLGLYISAEIIKRHKGKIWVESELGKGSTFIFTIPVKQQ